MSVEAKICGLSTPETIESALSAGAKYVGFVFFPPSPRNITPENASILADIAKGRALRVGVFVDPDDEYLAYILDIVDLDIIQLHGKETTDRVKHIKEKFSKRVMKAVAVASEKDILKAQQYEDVADMLLFDAKAPKDMTDALPGGNGLQFDWNLIAKCQWRIPWMLSGGLDTSNVSKAIGISGANTVDISSGIESALGVKDIGMIKTFMNTVREIKE